MARIDYQGLWIAVLAILLTIRDYVALALLAAMGCGVIYYVVRALL